MDYMFIHSLRSRKVCPYHMNIMSIYVKAVIGNSLFLTNQFPNKYSNTFSNVYIFRIYLFIITNCTYKTLKRNIP